jgi:hypothetical protein
MFKPIGLTGWVRKLQEATRNSGFAAYQKNALWFRQQVTVQLSFITK